MRCNETLLRATGYSREEVLGKTIFDLYHPDSLAAVRLSFAAFPETGELRAQELLRVFLDAAPVMIWMTDESYRTQMFNGEWLRFTGRNLEQELAVPWSSADVHPEDRSARLAAYDRHLKAHTKLAHEYRKDGRGEYRWI